MEACRWNASSTTVLERLSQATLKRTAHLLLFVFDHNGDHLAWGDTVLETKTAKFVDGLAFLVRWWTK